MAEVTMVDLRDQTYDQVDRYVKEWCDLPEGLHWKEIHRTRPFYGTVPQAKTSIVQDAILMGYVYRTNSTELMNNKYACKQLLNTYPYRYFRGEVSLQNVFHTDKGLWGHLYEGRIIFITGTYSEATQKHNVALFKRLADVWYDGHILSVTKDYTFGPETNDWDHPFVRPYVAILMARVKEHE